MELILDLGSGCSIPDFATGKRIIDSVAAVDTKKHDIIFKAQLFKDIPPNKPLDRMIFSRLKDYAEEAGYNMTASVFDKPSLDFLLVLHPVFVKIAAPPEYRWLIGKVPRDIPVYASNYSNGLNTYSFACISKYPAAVEDYLAIPWINHYDGISDHTVGWELWDLLSPQMGKWEKHYTLEHLPHEVNPDAGPFAVTAEELKEIL